MKDRNVRISAIVLALLFGFAAGVQVNDPDPIPWLAAYGVAAALCLAASHGRFFPRTTRVVLCLYLAAVALRLPALLDLGAISISRFHMADASEELAREAWGLALCAAACGFLLLAAAGEKARAA